MIAYDDIVIGSAEEFASVNNHLIELFGARFLGMTATFGHPDVVVFLDSPSVDDLLVLPTEIRYAALTNLALPGEGPLE